MEQNPNSALLKSSADLTYAAAPGFVARGGGTIINIASIVAVAPEIRTASTEPARRLFSP